ncbi:MAG: class I SAM-dependent methyltransferase [Acidiferrobacterales bacterium]
MASPGGDVKPRAHLPFPDTVELRLSQALTERIRQEMQSAGGSIDFMRFMELALYAPGLGYYSGGGRKFGAEGDFVTAPELGTLFARCLARQCGQVLRQLGKGDILEVGAGSGALAADLMVELAEAGQLPDRYLILELSADLRARQAEQVAKRIPELAQRIIWLDRLPEEGLRGVVIANEVLDAIPAQRFRWLPDGARMLQVAWEQNCFVWREAQAPSVFTELLQERIDLSSLASGYISEISPQAEAWVRSISQTVTAGLILIIDYGFPRAEFYHPDRSTGTLMCHYRHHVHADPLVLVGLQDISVHVDFTSIAEAGHDSGMSVLGYTSQAAFLLATGIAEPARGIPASDAKSFLQIAQEIRKLTLPHEMGELFKVLALGRGLPEPLLGFALQDRRARL